MNLTKLGKRAASLENSLARVRENAKEQAEDMLTAASFGGGCVASGLVDSYLDDPTIGESDVTYSAAAGGACLVGYFFAPKKYRAKLLALGVGLGSGLLREAGGSIAASLKK